MRKLIIALGLTTTLLAGTPTVTAQVIMPSQATGIYGANIRGFAPNGFSGPVMIPGPIVQMNVPLNTGRPLSVLGSQPAVVLPRSFTPGFETGYSRPLYDSVFTNGTTFYFRR